jgi:soluble lytic murein transglycosylase
MGSELTLERRRRRRTRARRRAAARAITVFLILALAGTAVYFVGFYPGRMDRIVYPVLYRELIERYADAYQLDPAHVAAVIYCESRYEPAAVSPVGARGLMQIMPDTGGWIAEKLSETDGYAQDLLFEPEWNIRYGCWYLNYLSGRFDGDFRKITAAYHAGGTRVAQWLEDPNYSKDGTALDAMPAGATNQYVKNVESTYEKYKELYAK